MNLNSPEFAKALRDFVDQRVEQRLKSYFPKFYVIGRVATASPLTCYIEESTTAVPVRNPAGISLNVSDIVGIILPNARDDVQRFVVHKL